MPSGRLSRPRFREAVKATKWPISRVARSAAEPQGLGAGDSRDAERLRIRCEQLRREAPRCRYRRHRPGSNSRPEWITGWVARGECGASIPPASPARIIFASLRLPLRRYTVRRLFALLGRVGRRTSSTMVGWRTVGSTVGSTVQFGCAWCQGLHFYGFSCYFG